MLSRADLQGHTEGNSKQLKLRASELSYTCLGQLLGCLCLDL